MECYTDYIDKFFDLFGYKDSYLFDEINKNDKPHEKFNKLAAKYFNSLTPNDAGYYSSEIIEYCPDIRNSIKDFFKTHTWQENLDYYFERAIKGLRLCNATDLYHTCGNGRPNQFGFSAVMLVSRCFIKYIYDIIKSLPLTENDTVDFRSDCFYIYRDLGFGHKASAYFEIDLNVYIKRDHKFGFTPYVKVSHDKGFFDELDSIKDRVKADIQEYKKSCKFLKVKIY